MSDVEWITDNWGIWKNRQGSFSIIFGKNFGAVSGRPLRNRRRAKKEIWYIENGLAEGPFHGAYRYIKEYRQSVN